MLRIQMGKVNKIISSAEEPNKKLDALLMKISQNYKSVGSLFYGNRRLL